MCGTMLTAIMGAFGLNKRAMHSIHLVDLLGFSPRAAAVGAFWGGLTGFCLWVAFLFWPGQPDISFVWQEQRSGDFVFLVAFVLLGIEAGAITRGLQPRMLETKTRANEGMRLSLRNGVIGGTVTGITTIVTILLLCGLVKERTLAESTLFSVGAGTLAFYCSFFWFGGFEVLKHYTLRSVLAATGQLPWRLVPFLEDATRLKLLQRVGGGYMFLHRLLAEHFAKNNLR